MKLLLPERNNTLALGCTPYPVHGARCEWVPASLVRGFSSLQVTASRTSTILTTRTILVLVLVFFFFAVVVSSLCL